MSEPLFKIAQQYREAADKLAESDLDEQTISDTLEGMAGEVEEKAIAVATVIKNAEAEARAIREAVADMESRLVRIENRAQALRGYLLDNLLACSIKRVSCQYFEISIRANPPSLIVDDVSLIPPLLMVHPPAPPPRPDKRAISIAIKAGESVPGAHLESGVRLEIK